MLFNKKNHLKFERSSFTLIELLIVIAIIGIMTSISAAAYVAMRNQRQVKVVAEQIKSRIVEAHSYAMTPPENNNLIGLQFVQVNISSNRVSNNTLQIVGVVGSNSVPIVSDNNFPKQTSIIIYPGSSNIRFIANNKDKMGQLDRTDDYSFTVANKNGTVKYKLTVNHITGAVDIKKI